MRTKKDGEAGPTTFTRRKRRDQLVDCAIEAVVDALLNQLATDPELDLEAYGAELVRLFDCATRKEMT